MYLSKNASRARIREAEHARKNRAEIVKGLSTGEVSRRDLFRWGAFTSLGLLAHVNGLSPFASSAFAQDIPTGTPRSPLFGAQPFTQPMPRLDLQRPRPLRAIQRGAETDVHFPDAMNQPPGRRLSYHTDFTASGGTQYLNPYYNIGPMEGRPPGEYFAHQRWGEYLPEMGYVMTLGRCAPGVKFHPAMPDQGIDQVWSLSPNMRGRCTLPPPLIKLRYGEPVLFRHYNRLPRNPALNGGFGSNSQSTHNHNAHNASGSDGATNAHFYPGQFYDYHWTTTLARADMTNKSATDRRASGPAKRGSGLELIPGDFRELQGTLWFHDHRFFYTAENVYKGHLGMLNYYSGPDRGHEGIDDGVNLRLPSGTELDWGNIDFDVNLIVSDGATDQDGQYFFDIFDTFGFCGDMMMVNFAYKPYFEVLPRKYRFRVLSAGMSRFVELGLVNPQGNPMPVQVIATDGNFLVNPVTVTRLDPMGPGERFDIVVDFSVFQRGARITMINTMEHANGLRPKGSVSTRDALRQNSDDPAVGGIMEFRVVDALASVDNPGKIHRRGDPDRSRVPAQLTQPIPIVQPVRTRIIEWKGETDGTGQIGECFPECGDKEVFPWTVRINGESQHFLNANRSSLLVPRPGEVEHWTLVNASGSWSHPVHLHLEEGVTIDRGGSAMTAIERANPRKDVWRLGPDGGTTVNIQVRFGEFGGAYVTHCHNTVHEDFGMLFRYDVLTDPNNPDNSQVHVNVIPTPKPSPEGVTYVTPEILPEGNPFDKNFTPFPELDT